MSFQKKIGKATILKGTNIDARYKVGFLRKDWPFLMTMKVVTKCKKNSHIPIGLDHAAHEFTYSLGNLTLRGKNPYNLLKQMALKGIIPLGVASANWSALWITVDNGLTYVCAKDLNHKNCTENGVALREQTHHFVPSD